MQSPVPLIPALAAHLVEAGGKRLRPLLTLAAARLCGSTGDAHVKLAASVEFIHTATLLHDDVVDQSSLRRGRPTANLVWGNQPSVLVGDFLFSRAFQLMVETNSVEVLGILASASAVIAEGEVMQLAASNNLQTTQAIYLQVVAAKTAALFEAAAKVGAVAAGRPAADAQALATYGLKLGIAFQLVDDALDYSGREASLGKTIGDDFREGKVTLPVILAYARGSEEDRHFWRRAIEDRKQGDGDLSRAIALMERTGSLSETIRDARFYAEEAKDALSPLPKNAYSRALVDLADFCVARVR
ncbi:MAG: polyprenyl synthetase family protein [Alphaproteobacteria bacterium]|nr:polyprenyl synthetase family protein [Alphaproteobacteria bacterium]